MLSALGRYRVWRGALEVARKSHVRYAMAGTEFRRERCRHRDAWKRRPALSDTRRLDTSRERLDTAFLPPAGRAVAVVAGAANAATTTIDTTDIVATISAGVTAISAIGVAVISLVVVIKLYKWVQRVL